LSRYTIFRSAGEEATKMMHLRLVKSFNGSADYSLKRTMSLPLPPQNAAKVSA
jgi:hypothetical protein